VHIIVFYNIAFLWAMVNWYQPISVLQSWLYMTWQEELRWDEMLIRRYQGREVWKLACRCSSTLWFLLVECVFVYTSCGGVFLQSLWNHRRFLSHWWIQHLLTVEENWPSTTSQMDMFVIQEIQLLSDCLHDPVDEFEESRVQAELSALYILWITKAIGSWFYPACLLSIVHFLA